jgi:hypothetical protein
MTTGDFDLRLREMAGSNERDLLGGMGRIPDNTYQLAPEALIKLLAFPSRTNDVRGLERWQALLRKTHAATALTWLVFAGCVAFLVGAEFSRTFHDAERYGYLTDIMPSDWRATNIWLDSTDCALQRGAWLALCEKDKLVPISERAIADDPGHALLLELWSMAVQRRATVTDVARLNTLVDTIGLVALAGLLFALRAYLTAIVLMVKGPVEFLHWMGTSPHWSYIGLVALGAVLPLALAAREFGLLSRRSANLWIAAGLLFLAIATLMRESIGIMGVALGLGALVLVTLRLPRPRPRIAALALVGALALVAFTMPRWVVLARDASFDMQPAQRLATHGLSHTLYLGLGYVENKWGIRYDDDYGEETAQKIDPTIVFCSPEYFRLMWRLYLARWLEDPLEVMRIYLDKARELLAAPTIYPGPPFGFMLLAGLVHLAAATALGAWSRIGFPQGLLIEAVALCFIGLFLAQATLALPSQTYAMPVNTFVLVLAGVVLEFFVRTLLNVKAAL